ncbi:hypothetical protein [Neobacillus sp. Marseille-QA0830]
MIINIGQCMDCHKKLKGQGHIIYEEILVDGRGSHCDKVVIGLVCDKCNKKRLSAVLISLVRKHYKRQRRREIEEKDKQRRLKKIRLL